MLFRRFGVRSVQGVNSVAMDFPSVSKNQIMNAAHLTFKMNSQVLSSQTNHVCVRIFFELQFFIILTSTLVLILFGYCLRYYEKFSLLYYERYPRQNTPTYVNSFSKNFVNNLMFILPQIQCYSDEGLQLLRYTQQVLTKFCNFTSRSYIYTVLSILTSFRYKFSVYEIKEKIRYFRITTTIDLYILEQKAYSLKKNYLHERRLYVKNGNMPSKSSKRNMTYEYQNMIIVKSGRPIDNWVHGEKQSCFSTTISIN